MVPSRYDAAIKPLVLVATAASLLEMAAMAPHNTQSPTKQNPDRLFPPGRASLPASLANTATTANPTSIPSHCQGLSRSPK